MALCYTTSAVPANKSRIELERRLGNLDARDSFGSDERVPWAVCVPSSGLINKGENNSDKSA